MRLFPRREMLDLVVVSVMGVVGWVLRKLEFDVAPLILALVLGPVFCSWVCPWGFLSEGIDAVRQRLEPFGRHPPDPDSHAAMFRA